MTFVESTMLQDRRNRQINPHRLAGFEGMRKAGALDKFIFEFGRLLNIVGGHGHTSRMYVTGESSRRARGLIEITYRSLPRGGAAVKPGATTSDVGHAIQGYAEGERCLVVRDFHSHGLGGFFHDEPNILHVGRRGEGIPPLGMFFMIEPMIKLGEPAVKVLSDGWIAVTRDRSLAALGVTETGIEIFTISPAGLDRPPLSS